MIARWTIPLLILCAWACGAQGMRPDETPADYAVRLAAEHRPSAVADRLRELLAEGVVEPAALEPGLVGRGYLLLQEGRIDASATVLQAAVELFPDSWRAWENLGEVAIYQGDSVRARQSLERSLALDSVHSGARWTLPELDRMLREAAAETPELARFRPGEATGLTGPYLGQATPGAVPEIFAPGIVSTRGGHEFSCTFSPDAREFYFNRGPDIYAAYWREAGWTAPAPVPFNTDALDHEPHISPDGTRLFFGSARPREVAEGENPYGIWVMERSGGGWGAPTFLFPGMFVTTTASGDVYLTHFGAETGEGIAVRRWRDGAYLPPERVPVGVNERRAAHPVIAPDGSFMIFDGSAGGPEDLFLSVPTAGGSWTEALPLAELNTWGVEMTAALSPDGRYLFYYSHHDIWWVSTEVLRPYLEELRRGAGGGPATTTPTRGGRP